MKKEALQKYIIQANEYYSARTALLPEIKKIARNIFLHRNPTYSNYYSFPKDDSLYDDDIIISEDTICIKWEEYHCGETDYNELEFPTDYLFMSDDEWKVIEQQKKDERIRKAEEDRVAKEIEDAKRQRVIDLEEFNRLKIKLNL